MKKLTTLQKMKNTSAKFYNVRSFQEELANVRVNKNARKEIIKNGSK